MRHSPRRIQVLAPPLDREHRDQACPIRSTAMTHCHQHHHGFAVDTDEEARQERVSPLAGPETLSDNSTQRNRHLGSAILLCTN